ncbi:MAG: PAS domain S-box protein [Chlorobium sp.]
MQNDINDLKPENPDHSDNALFVSQEGFRHLFDSLINGCAYCRIIYEKGVAVDFIHEAVNPAFSKLTGLKEVVGKKASEVLPTLHESNPELLERFARVAESGIADRFEIHIKALNAWHDISAFSCSKGEFFGVFEDITARKETEHKLKESEDRFRKLFERHAAIKLLIHACTGAIIDANPAAARFYGWSVEELRQMQIGQINLLPTEEIKKNLEKISASEQQQFCFRHRRADNSVCDVEVFCNKIEIAGDELIYAIIHDITDRNQAEQKLKESEERFRKLFESHSAIQLVTDPDTGAIVDANPAAAKFYGWSVEELRKMKTEQLSINSPQTVKINLENIRSSEQSRLFFCHRRVDDSVRDVEVFSNKIEIAGKELLYSIIHDVTERKLAEKKLTDSEVRFRTLFESNSAIKLLIDHATGAIIDANPKAAEFYGWSVDKLRKLKIEQLSILSPATVKENLKKISSSEQNSFLFRHRRADNSLCDVEVFSNKVTIEGKELLYTIIHDITDRKLAEEKLRESEERFRHLFENHSAIKMLINPDTGNIVDANPAAAKFYGWSIEELRQMQMQQINILPPEAVKKEMEKCKLAKRNHFEFRHKRKDGSIRDVEVLSSGIKIAGRILLYSIIHDDTERKRLEIITEFRLHLFKMAESHSVTELIQATLDKAERVTESSIGFCHLIMDDNAPSIEIWSTNTIKINSRMKGHRRGGHPSLDRSVLWADALRERKAVIHNDYSAFWPKHGGPDTHPGITRTLVVPVMKGKNVMAMLGVANKPFLYDEEDIRWVNALANIASDIIDTKLAGAREKKTLEALIQSQKMEIVGRLTGGIAHDFSNMLCVILGYTEMALKDITPELPIHANLEAIHTAATRSADLSQKLLAFARNKSVTPKIIELNTMVEGMITLLKRLIGEDITLLWKPESETAKVNIEPVHLDQILANLCLNARDAIENNGQITIETSLLHLDKADCVDYHLNKEAGDYVILSVTDNGHGIEKKYLPHIFEPFFTTKPVGQGTGLGLSIIYSIIKQNNGYIECESKRQKGSTFRIYLPRYKDDAGITKPAKGEPKPEIAITHGKATILLVEDEPDILVLCKEMFEQNGYTVLSASTPSDAIQLAEEHKNEINLLLSDVVLPEMSGCDLYKKLLPTISDLKALFMSGYTADVIARHEVLDKSVNFIQKPFRFKSLSIAVHETLAPPPRVVGYPERRRRRSADLTKGYQAKNN